MDMIEKKQVIQLIKDLFLHNEFFCRMGTQAQVSRRCTDIQLSGFAVVLIRNRLNQRFADHKPTNGKQ
jgi:hypothetical protein